MVKRTGMLYYLTAFGLIAHTCFWGLGLALLTLPRIWRRWAWVFAPGFGFALQSAVVWGGVHTSLAGTDSYAWWSEVIPAVLLLVALFQKPRRFSWRHPGLVLLLVFAGWLLISPMTVPGSGLTSSSLGNCDQADYAAGARAFQEFSRDDRTGFMGLPEVTKVRSADYFFDFWVRLNHFTPSALIAHNASIFKVESFRLVSIMAAAVVLLNLPIVYFLARVTVGMRGIWLVGLVALYGLSTLTSYAVYHGQLGQLYAAQGIALLTVGIFGAIRSAAYKRGIVSFLPVLLVGFWILAGSYNFILPVCLAPAGAYLLAQVFRTSDWKMFGRVLTLIVSALGLCVVLFWGRFDGLVERFSLFHQYDFGWAVPLFSPEGILGVVDDSNLNARETWVRFAISAAILCFVIFAVFALWKRNRSAVLASVALVLPVMIGWAILACESRVRANASYDAYKLISVFLPGLLVGFGCWLAAAHRSKFTVQLCSAIFLFLILAANLHVNGHFRRLMSVPPFRVNRNVVELSLLEKEPQIKSINMLVEDYWSRLWANAFLLKKPQYFAVHTYEGRLNTELKGEWNLSDSLLRNHPLNDEDFRQFNVRFFLVRANAPGLLQAHFSDGWYREERVGPKRWRWCGGKGNVLLENHTGVRAQVRLRLLIQSFRPRDLTVCLDGRFLEKKSLDGTNQVVEWEIFSVPPGSTVLSMESESFAAGGNDTRSLAFALYGMDMRTLALEK